MKFDVYKSICFLICTFLFSTTALAGLIKVDIEFEATNFITDFGGSSPVPVDTVNGNLSFIFDDSLVGTSSVGSPLTFDANLGGTQFGPSDIHFEYQVVGGELQSAFFGVHNATVGDDFTTMFGGTTDMWLSFWRNPFSGDFVQSRVNYAFPNTLDFFVTHTVDFSINFTEVPEPAGLAIFTIGLLRLGARRFKKSS